MAETLTQEVRLRKGAIHCMGCSATIQRSLSKLPGVEEAEANERTQTVRVKLDPKVIDIETVREHLDAMGFTPAV